MSKDKKYELIPSDKDGFYRVRALREIRLGETVIRKGDIGGCVAGEHNLSQDGDARVYGNAWVSSIRDYVVFKNWWSSGRYFTWTRSNNMWRVGCFYGTGKQLIERAYRDSEESGREYERIVKYVEQINKPTGTE